MSRVDKSLGDFMRESESDLFLLLGPPAPKAGWVYRDFRPMPQAMWLELLDRLGDDNVTMVAATSKFLPPAELCRAQIWLSPAGQAAWANYLRRQTGEDSQQA